VIEIR
jgi:hypothetical protein